MERILLYAAFVYVPIVCLTLVAYAKRIKVMRFIFKSLLMPSLAVFYLLAAESPSPWIVLALASDGSETCFCSDGTTGICTAASARLRSVTSATSPACCSQSPARI